MTEIALRPGGWRLGAAAFAALIARDLRVLARMPASFLLRTVVNPLMFVFVFTYLYPRIGAGRFGQVAGQSLATIALPGLIASAIYFQGLNAVALPLSMEFSATREIEDRVMAPVPYAAAALAKVCCSAVQSLLAAAVVFPLAYLIPAAPVRIHIASWAALILALTLGSLLAGCLGLLLGTVVEVRKIALVFAVTIVPLTFLGCVYYPWASLHSIRWIQILVLANPLVYLSEALRAALTPSLPHMSTLASLPVLAAITVLLGWAAITTFTRRVLT
ncbi:MAG TPA: ABC transporter permease [Streptosporangiaceae bacterium]|nr:ABC transporter permease [Streptosporangiaceae bacterium]